MKVKARPGEQCPMEGKPREYITDAEPGVAVPDDSLYYLRLIADGSLVRAEEHKVFVDSVGSARTPKNQKEAKDGK